jgi:hypothetical protein
LLSSERNREEEEEEMTNKKISYFAASVERLLEGNKLH